MMIEAAIVQVDRTDHGLAVIADKNFGMDEAGRILVNLYACFRQGMVVGLGK